MHVLSPITPSSKNLSVSIVKSLQVCTIVPTQGQPHQIWLPSSFNHICRTVIRCRFPFLIKFSLKLALWENKHCLMKSRSAQIQSSWVPLVTGNSRSVLRNKLKCFPHVYIHKQWYHLHVEKWVEITGGQSAFLRVHSRDS